MKRSTAQLNSDRADLLAALAEAPKPVNAAALVALAQGYDLRTIPDTVLNAAWSHAYRDLRALAKAGHLVYDTHGFIRQRRGARGLGRPAPTGRRVGPRGLACPRERHRRRDPDRPASPAYPVR